VDLRTLQRPLKDRYRAAPDTARITLRARGAQADVPTACSVDLGRVVRPAPADPDRVADGLATGLLVRVPSRLTHRVSPPGAPAAAG
jgi:hypothetical protein